MESGIELVQCPDTAKQSDVHRRDLIITWSDFTLQMKP
jgi:hypothetical protein